MAVNGDWIGGRMFWNGQFGAPGVVMDPNAAGYLKPVSSEVNKQSDAAQGLTAGSIDAYLAGLRATPGGDAGMAADGSALAGGGSSALSALSGGSTGPVNLQNIYDTAYKAAGITDLQKQWDDIQTEIDTKKGTVAKSTSSINENPWGAEATRTGKISKLENFANDQIGVLVGQQNAIGTKINAAKADVETKLNLATKQVDINQSAASQSLTMFNSLLSAGALTGASSDDLAQFARSSGLPISFLNSAVKSSQAKNTETKLIESTDDNGNVTVSLVTIKDGQLTVAGKQSLGNVGKAAGTSASATKAEAISKTVQILDSMKNSYGNVDPAQWAQVRSAAMIDGITAEEFNKNFASYTDPNRGDFSASYGFDIKNRGASQFQVINQN